MQQQLNKQNLLRTTMLTVFVKCFVVLFCFIDECEFRNLKNKAKHPLVGDGQKERG